MVRQRFGVAEDDNAETTTAKLAEGLDSLIPDLADRTFLKPGLAHLLGVGGGERSRDDLFAGWRMLIERMAEQHPVVLAVEDLQWADEGFLDFLDSILDWSAEYPILMLTLSRPELGEVRPGWASAAAPPPSTSSLSTPTRWPRCCPGWWTPSAGPGQPNRGRIGRGTPLCRGDDPQPGRPGPGAAP